MVFIDIQHRAFLPIQFYFASFRDSCIRIARAVGPRMNVNTVAMMKSEPPATMVLIAPNAGTAHPVMRYPTIPAREKTTPHEAVDAPAHVFVDSVCEEDLPEHFFGSVEHAPR